MTKTPNIHEQIFQAEQQMSHMQRAFPAAVADKKITQEHANIKLARQAAIVNTLTQLRGIVRGEEIPHHE